MATSFKFVCIIGLLLVVNIATFANVNGAGESGKSSPDDEEMKLAPCALAGQYEKAAVSISCCTHVKRISQNPSCLCAILLCDTAKASGVNPQVALSIPKRCNFANRLVGYKCRT